MATFDAHRVLAPRPYESVAGRSSGREAGRDVTPVPRDQQLVFHLRRRPDRKVATRRLLASPLPCHPNPTMTLSDSLRRPLTRRTLQALKSLCESPPSPSISWHPAADCYIPPVTHTSRPDPDAVRRRVRLPQRSVSKPYSYDPQNPQHAAVLVALANVSIPSTLRPGPDSVAPSILLEVRSSKMRSHAGEVR